MGTILIAGLRELGVHGVLPEEQARPQPFEVDVELAVDLERRGRDRRPRRHRRLPAVCEAVQPRRHVRAVPPPRAAGDAHRRGVSGRRTRSPASRSTVRKLHPPVRAMVDHVAVRIERDAASDTRRAYLGLGSNLGDRLAYLQLAVDELAPARRRRGRRGLAGLRDRAGRRARAGRRT